MLRDDFQAISNQRVKDAKILLDNKRFPAAYYLAGYAVECALKACIAKQTRKYEFPDKKRVNESYTHNLTQLLETAGLKREHSKQEKNNGDFATNWAIVKDWDEKKRYDRSITEKAARDLYSAVTAGKNGVLQWLKKSR